MYIAFRWLITLSLAMWLALCCLDIYLMDYKIGIFLSTNESAHFKSNHVSTLKDKIENKTRNWNVAVGENYKQPGVTVLHYVIFLTCASAVLIYNRKSLFISYWTINTDKATKFLERNITSHNLKITVKYAGVAISHYWNFIWDIMRNYISKAAKRLENGQNTNLSLLQRLKNITQDRNALGQLLMAAIDENKNIRRQFQLEVIAKNRLLRLVQDTQTVMKENKSRFVDFKQLYLLTEKENCLLKDHIRTLRNEKDDAEKKLIELINVVFRSKNNDLKAYCSRFIVHTKNNLLNSDVRAEIQKFLQKSNEPVTKLIDGTNYTSHLRNMPTTRVTEILEDNLTLVNLVSSRPKCRRLPGECVWTVKDKNGIIEKLYEYNFETKNDNGDVIRRIRQYSVYHDNDCFLEHINFGTNIPTCPSLSASATRIRLDIKSISNQLFLTKVLLTNNPLRLPSTSETDL